MMIPPNSILAFFFATCLLNPTLGIAGDDKFAVSEAIKAQAEANNMAFGDIHEAFTGTDLEKDDEITLLAVLEEGGIKRESLINLRWTGELKNDRAKVVKRFASTGHIFEYESDRYVARALTVGTIGKRLKQEGQAEVSLEFLQMGFFDVAKFYYELEVKRANDPSLPEFWFYTNRSTPVDSGTINAQEQLMEQLSVGESFLRTLAASGVSSDSLLDTLNNTDGISDILWSVAKRPSAFSMLRGGIKTSERMGGTVSKLDPLDFGLPPGLECYRYPIELSINGKKAVNLELLVAKADGPIRQTAGVFGLEAYPPDGTGKRLSIRIIGAESN